MHESCRVGGKLPPNTGPPLQIGEFGVSRSVVTLCCYSTVQINNDENLVPVIPCGNTTRQCDTDQTLRQ